MRKILITNDDGIKSEGLLRLVNVAKDYGEVWVVAPDDQRSACSHSITVHGTIDIYPYFFFCMALDDCGRHDLAAEIAGKYCRTLKEHGFFHINNALTGREDRSLTAFGERGLFWSAWTSSCYLFLASRYGAEK